MVASRFEPWIAGWRAALSDIREDTSHKEFYIVAGAAFLTFAYLGRGRNVKGNRLTYARKVVAGTLLTTMIAWWFLLPLLRVTKGTKVMEGIWGDWGFSDEMKDRIRREKEAFGLWKLERKDKRLTKKQEKATHHLRKLIIKKMINLRPFGTLNWSHTGADWGLPVQGKVLENYDDLVDEANEMIGIAVKTDMLGKKGDGSLDDMVEQWRRDVGERAW